MKNNKSFFALSLLFLFAIPTKSSGIYSYSLDRPSIKQCIYLATWVPFKYSCSLGLSGVTYVGRKIRDFIDLEKYQKSEFEKRDMKNKDALEAFKKKIQSRNRIIKEYCQKISKQTVQDIDNLKESYLQEVRGFKQKIYEGGKQLTQEVKTLDSRTKNIVSELKDSQIIINTLGEKQSNVGKKVRRLRKRSEVNNKINKKKLNVLEEEVSNLKAQLKAQALQNKKKKKTIKNLNKINESLQAELEQRKETEKLMAPEIDKLNRNAEFSTMYHRAKYYAITHQNGLATGLYAFLHQYPIEELHATSKTSNLDHSYL